MPSPPEEYRIVVLGGSSALGEPYRPWLSVGQIVAWQLGEKVKGRRFECEILAWLGESLEMQHHRLAGLRHRPDAVIIYSGHNEFAARFEEEREGWLEEEPRTWPLALAYRATLISPFRRLVYEVISKNRLDSPPPVGGAPPAHRPSAVQPGGGGPDHGRLWSPARSDRGLLRANRRFADCDRAARQRGWLRAEPVDAAARRARARAPAALSRSLRPPVPVSRTIPQASARAYEAIIARHPGFAEAHFRLGRLLERAGELRRRGRALPRGTRSRWAADPRARPPCGRPARLVAERHPRAILIDGRTELMAVSPSGLLDDHVIQDTHHPTLVGYTALAGAVLREIGRRGVFGAAVSFE